MLETIRIFLYFSFAFSESQRRYLVIKQNIVCYEKKTIVKLQRVHGVEVAFKVWWYNHPLETNPAGDNIYTSGQNQKDKYLVILKSQQKQTDFGEDSVIGEETGMRMNFHSLVMLLQGWFVVVEWQGGQRDQKKESSLCQLPTGD